MSSPIVVRGEAGVGKSSLLEDLAEQGPLLAIVDDASGSTGPRRMPCCSWPGAWGSTLSCSCSEPGRAMPPGSRRAGSPISSWPGSAAAVALIGDRRGVEPAGTVAARLVSATHGNTLAIAEIATALDAAALAGETPLPDPPPLSRGVEAAFLDRVSAFAAAVPPPPPHRPRSDVQARENWESTI